MAEKIKRESNKDVIISAIEAKNLLILKFISDDEKITCFILCNEEEIFNEIIYKVYQINPNYNNRKNHFLCNDSIVNEYKSLKENKVKNGNLIILVKPKDKITINGIDTVPHTDEQKEKDKLNILASKLKKETKIDQIKYKNLITLKFESEKPSINLYILCNENDIFNSIINKIFEQKHEFKEYGNIFYVMESKLMNINL